MFGYRGTAWCVSRCLPNYVASAAGLVFFGEVARLFDGSVLGSGAKGAWVGLIAGLAFGFVRAILLRERLPTLRTPKGYHSGGLRFFGVGVVIVLLPLAAGVAFLVSRFSWGELVMDQGALSGAAFGAFLVGNAVLLLMLLVFGTALPAATAGDRGVLIGAIRRAPWAAWRVLLGLLIGPLPFTQAAAWAYLEAAARLDLLGVPVVLSGGAIHWPAAALATGQALAALITGTFVAAVLCDAYVKTEGDPREPMAPPVPA